MQLWFTCKENELNGPYTRKEMEEQLQNKEILPHHWVRLQEEANWTVVSEHQEFKEFSEKKEDLEVLEEKWVLLHLSDEGQKQLGPYTTAELLNMVYLGDADYSDFVWKQGFSEWKRMGSLDCFIPSEEVKKNPIKKQVKQEKQLDHNEQLSLFDDLMKNETHPMSFYQDNLVPEEARKKEVKDRFVIKNKTDIKKNKDGIPTYYKPVKNKKQRWWIFSFFCLFLTIMIAVWGKSGLSLYL